MEPYIQAYFSKAISRGVNENGDVSDADEPEIEQFEAPKPTKKGAKGVKPTNGITVTHICELIYELNIICPVIVQGTICVCLCAL